jgi:hypothetical protein
VHWRDDTAILLLGDMVEGVLIGEKLLSPLPKSEDDF